MRGIGWCVAMAVLLAGAAARAQPDESSPPDDEAESPAIVPPASGAAPSQPALPSLLLDGRALGLGAGRGLHWVRSGRDALLVDGQGHVLTIRRGIIPVRPPVRVHGAGAPVVAAVPGTIATRSGRIESVTTVDAPRAADADWETVTTDPGPLTRTEVRALSAPARVPSRSRARGHR